MDCFQTVLGDCFRVVGSISSNCPRIAYAILRRAPYKLLNMKKWRRRELSSNRSLKTRKLVIPGNAGIARIATSATPAYV